MIFNNFVTEKNSWEKSHVLSMIEVYQLVGVCKKGTSIIRAEFYLRWYFLYT